MTSLADEMVSVTRNLRPRTPKSEISSAGEFVYARRDDIDNVRKFTSYHINIQLQAYKYLKMGIFARDLFCSISVTLNLNN